MQIKLKCGVEINVSENAMNNMELVDLLAEGNVDSNIIAVSKMLKMIVSDKDRKVIYDAARKEDGTVPIEHVTASVKEIFDAFKENGKNS